MEVTPKTLTESNAFSHLQNRNRRPEIAPQEHLQTQVRGLHMV
jgi:hypothetical protein